MRYQTRRGHRTGPGIPRRQTAHRAAAGTRRGGAGRHGLDLQRGRATHPREGPHHTLDQDGPDPTEETEGINQLRWQRNPDRPGGKIYGRYDSAAQFDSIVSAIEGGNKPVDTDDPRDLSTRNAESLANACSFFLAHADSDLLPETGGRKANIHVPATLEDLENRARSM